MAVMSILHARRDGRERHKEGKGPRKRGVGARFSGGRREKRGAPGLRGFGVPGLVLAAMLLGVSGTAAAPAQFVSTDVVAEHGDATWAGSAFALRLPVPARVDTAVAEELANYSIHPIGGRVWPTLHAAHVIGSGHDAGGVKTVVVWGAFAPATTYVIRFAHRGGVLSFEATTPRAAAAPGGGDLPLLTRFLTAAFNALDDSEPEDSSLNALKAPDAERPGLRYRTTVTLPDPLGLAARVPGGRTGSSLAFGANGTLGGTDDDTSVLSGARAVLSFSHRRDFAWSGNGHGEPRPPSAAALSSTPPAGMSFGVRVIPVGLEFSENMERLVYRGRLELEGSASVFGNVLGIARSRPDSRGMILRSLVGYTVRHLVMTPAATQTPTSGVVDGQVSVAMPLRRTLHLDGRLRAEYGTTDRTFSGAFEAGLRYAVDRNEAATLSLTYSNTSWPQDFRDPGAVRVDFRMSF